VGFDNTSTGKYKPSVTSLFHDQTSTSSAEKEAKLHAVKQQLP
jgi:hypothetical protein